MANTITKLNSFTATSSTASFTFSSIPQTYTDLLFCYSHRTTDTVSSNIVTDLIVRFNSVSSGYSGTWMRNLSSSASSFRSTGGTSVPGTAGAGRNATANSFSNGQMYIPNYTGSNFKQMIIDTALEHNAANYDSANYSVAGLWSNTAAITSIVCTDGYANIATGATFTLYGIKNTA